MISMVFFPILGSAPQPRYTGPYRVERRVGEVNYVIATPDRRKTSRLCHINMLKRYCERDAAAKVMVPVEGIVSAVALSSTASAAHFTSAPTQRGPVALLLGEVGVHYPAAKVVEGRLKNSEILSDLIFFFHHYLIQSMKI